MMKLFTYKPFLFTLLLFFTLTQLPAQFTLTGEVRPRSEFRNGFKTPTTEDNKPAFFTEQRSRIYFDYKESKFKFRLSLQDVRIWGETSQIFKEESNNTFLSEAWGQYFITPKFSAKFGRQIISYDNQRFLGGLEWAQQGRRHDAFLFLYEDAESKAKVHVGVALNADDDIPEPILLQGTDPNFYSTGGNYKAMQYLWANKKFDKGSVSALALNATYQNADSTASSKQTLGLLGNYKVGPVVVGGDVYYQTGQFGGKDVNALLAGINVTYKTKLTPIKVGFEHISGQDDDDTGETIRNFSPDFGTNHAHNGLMDYFFVGPANGNVGVNDIYLKTKFKLGKKSFLVANFHEFLTGSRQLDINGTELAKPMGFEIDLVYGVKLAKGVSFNLGFSQMFATDTMIALRAGTQKSNNWAWMMMTYKPVLYKTPEKPVQE